ncbi:Cof-type HAD-IIB family hydrolase [Halalkalibacter flavus]|uniref:Cof-type HAD-IIB family hydrolase n=1 Tax=Halalkalibacter flavus TaxID=3090668 RepID=UPI002FCBB2FC
MKVIAIDLDGTLLSENLSIHEKDVCAIKEAQKQDYIVAIATGRALFDAQHIAKKHDLDCPIIASNGAQIYVDYKKIDEQFIKQSIVQAIIPWLNEREMYYQAYLSDKIVVSNLGINYLEKQLHDVMEQNSDFNLDEFWKGIKAQIYQYGLEEKTGTILPTDYHSIIKIMVVSPNVHLLKEVKAHFQQITGCEISSSGTFNLEIMSTGVDKGITLRKLCNYYETSVENAVAIGDNLNDMPMFQVAATGIAMGNADKELVRVSTYQTLSNQECGVAYAFEKYIKANKVEDQDVEEEKLV